MDTLLSVSHVSYSYHTLSGETPALSDITFSVKEGEFLSIVGPSGCGKSTLLSLLASLMEPESGTIILRGKPLAPHTANIGYMLQKDHLFEWRTVYRNIVLGLEIQKKMTPAYLHHVDQLMEAYGLWAFRNSRPSELSGLSLIHISGESSASTSTKSGMVNFIDYILSGHLKHGF